MRTLEGKRLGIYTRASSDEKDEKGSVTAQGGYGERWGLKHGCTIADDARYSDNDKSASWYATKARTDFQRLLADIAAGKLDLIWFWAVSRSQRDLSVYVTLRDLCRRQGVGWVVKNRVYDLSDPSDLKSLGIDAVTAEVQSVEISENVRAGMDLAAQLGKPHGPTTYGYRRIYSDRGVYVTQVPHDVHADVVREIIMRVSQGEPIARLSRDFEARGVPAPLGGARWSRSVLTRIASNPAYIGRRVYQGQVIDHPEPCWTPLVDDETFYRAQSVLKAPGRKTTKPGRAVHLCSYIIRCECGEWLAAKTDTRVHHRQGGASDSPGHRMYACLRRCSAVGADELDDFVRAVIDEYMTRPYVREFLAAVHADDSEVVQARGEAARLRVELEENKQAREAGRLDLGEYLRFKESLSVRIADAESRAEQASLPPVLRAGVVDWSDIAVARQIVGFLADIRLKPVGKGRRGVPVWERIDWKWLIGPDAT